jgi:hypothetical protein
MKKLIYILLAVLLVSCGARKTQVTKQDIQIEETTKVSEQLSIISESSETLIDTSSTTEYLFEPIDSTQPMVIDKKNGIFKNTRFKTSKTKNGISISKSQESSLEAKKSTLNEMSIDIETKDKESDRKESFGGWVWLIILIVIIIGYTKYKKIW